MGIRFDALQNLIQSRKDQVLCQLLGMRACHTCTCYCGQPNQKMQSPWLESTSGRGRQLTGISYPMTTSMDFAPKIARRSMISQAPIVRSRRPSSRPKKI
jgi:hypothetical protein